MYYHFTTEFVGLMSSITIRLNWVSVSGFFLCRHYDYMLAKQVKDMYQDFLVNGNASVKLRCQVLKNLQLYLVQEEISMSKSDAECELLIV